MNNSFRQLPANFSRFIKPAAGAGALVAASVGNLAHAAAGDSIDVTGVVAKIDAAIGPIGLIGAAVLLVVVAIAAFKWVRRAIS